MDDRISERAHQLWEEAGRPEGQSDHFWLAAEREAQAVEARTDEALVESFPASDPLANTGITGPEIEISSHTATVPEPAAPPVVAPQKAKSSKAKSAKTKSGGVAKSKAVRPGDHNDAPASWN